MKLNQRILIAVVILAVEVMTVFLQAMPLIF